MQVGLPPDRDVVRRPRLVEFRQRLRFELRVVAPPREQRAADFLQDPVQPRDRDFLAREAVFLLVFASRPAITEQLIGRLLRRGPSGGS